MELSNIPGVKTPENHESGVIDPKSTLDYSKTQAKAVLVYSDGQDLLVVTWNLMPGQENESHAHPNNAHCFVIIEGEGTYIKGQPGTPECKSYPVRAGDTVWIPRGTIHGIRNTGDKPMAYFGITTSAGGEYQRVVNGVVQDH